MIKETSTPKKAKEPKVPKLFPDELIDELLAQMQNRDAESILCETGLAGYQRAHSVTVTEYPVTIPMSPSTKSRQ